MLFYKDKNVEWTHNAWNWWKNEENVLIKRFSCFSFHKLWNNVWKMQLLQKTGLYTHEWQVVKFLVSIFDCRTLSETGQPPYLAKQLCAYAPTRALCSSTSKFLQVPCTNLQFGSRSFCASAPTLWNSLPHSVHFCESLTTFLKHLKTFYFQSVSWLPLATHYPSASDSVFDIDAL